MASDWNHSAPGGAGSSQDLSDRAGTGVIMDTGRTGRRAAIPRLTLAAGSGPSPAAVSAPLAPWARARAVEPCGVARLPAQAY